MLVHNLDPHPVPNERGVVRRTVDSFRHPIERELERGVGNRKTRKDLGAEEARVKPAESSDRPEAVARPVGSTHRAAPVGIHAELVRGEGERLVARTELDRIVSDHGEPLFELGDGLALGEAPDADTRNLRTLGKLLA